MIQAVFLPFVTILLAELFDKSQLSILLLSSETKNRLQLFFGVFLAFIIVDGTAILLGSQIAQLVPQHIIQIASGVLFILFGLASFKLGSEKLSSKRLNRNAFLAGLLLILVAEWGDKTQIVSAVFATQYNPVLVAIGVFTALGLLSFVTIYLGKLLQEKINPKKIRYTAGVVFIVMGVISLLGAIL